jgi:hypothetical protein
MEIKEIFEALSIDGEKVKTKEDLIAHVNKDFVKRNEAEKDPTLIAAISGKLVGSIETKAKTIAKEFDIDTTGEDFKELRPLERLDKVVSLAKSKYDTEINNYKSQIKGDDGKLVAEWEKKYNKVEIKLKETEGLLSSVTGELETTKTNSANQIKSFKLGNVKETAFKKIEWSKDVDELKKKGFNTLLEEKFVFDIDENDQPFVLDKATKKKIESKKTAGTFATFEEIIEKEAIENKMISVNPSQSSPTIKNVFGALDLPANQNLANNGEAIKKGFNRQVNTSTRGK